MLTPCFQSSNHNHLYCRRVMFDFKRWLVPKYRDLMWKSLALDSSLDFLKMKMSLHSTSNNCSPFPIASSVIKATMSITGPSFLRLCQKSSMFTAQLLQSLVHCLVTWKYQIFTEKNVFFIAMKFLTLILQVCLHLFSSFQFIHQSMPKDFQIWSLIAWKLSINPHNVPCADA